MTRVGGAYSRGSRTPAVRRGFFGNTVPGGANGGHGPDFLVSSKYTLWDSGASMTSMSIYFGGTAVGAVCRFAIYSNQSNNTPSSLLGVTRETRCDPAGTPQWFTASFPSPFSIPAGDYWLTVWTGVGTVNRFYDDVPNALQFAAGDTYSAVGFPNDPYTPTGSLSQRLTIYASYSV